MNEFVHQGHKGLILTKVSIHITIIIRRSIIRMRYSVVTYECVAMQYACNITCGLVVILIY